MRDIYYLNNSRHKQRRWALKASLLPLTNEALANFPQVGEFVLVDRSLVDLTLRQLHLTPDERRRRLDKARAHSLTYEQFCAATLRPDSVSAA